MLKLRLITLHFPAGPTLGWSNLYSRSGSQAGCVCGSSGYFPFPPPHSCASPLKKTAPTLIQHLTTQEPATLSKCGSEEGPQTEQLWAPPLCAFSHSKECWRGRSHGSSLRPIKQPGRWFQLSRYEVWSWAAPPSSPPPPLPPPLSSHAPLDFWMSEKGCHWPPPLLSSLWRTRVYSRAHCPCPPTRPRLEAHSGEPRTEVAGTCLAFALAVKNVRCISPPPPLLHLPQQNLSSCPMLLLQSPG